MIIWGARGAGVAAAPPRTGTGVIDAGITLAGKYKLESKIGAGAFGAVFKAKHLALDNYVAIKVLQSNMMPTEEALKRFQREGISACRIQHPNAVSILDFGVTDDGVAYLAMELLSGQSLADELKGRGSLSPARCAEILTPLCDVLGEAHAASIIHRDIKPANVFLHKGRGGETVKVLDFGIAKLMDEGGAELTVEGTLVGTPAYMAPERLAGQVYDGRSDIYSLGIMLYEMLCGQPPFKSPDLMAVAMMQMTQEPKPLRTHNPNVAPAVEAVVMELLVKDPDKRASATGLAERFAKAVASAPPSSASPSAPEQTIMLTTPPTLMAAPAPVRAPRPGPPSAAPRPPRPPAGADAREESPEERPKSWLKRLFGR
jgi:serine/threonine protein kinase